MGDKGSMDWVGRRSRLTSPSFMTRGRMSCGESNVLNRSSESAVAASTASRVAILDAASAECFSFSSLATGDSQNDWQVV